MHNVASAAATSVDGIGHRSETWLPARRVKAGDLRPGDIVRQYDWSLHIRKVDVSGDHGRRVRVPAARRRRRASAIGSVTIDR